ncbi:MAG: sugar phosphate isomerase/epimerase [Phycisphaerales bacterium]|nr:sugar phosphate isomerase/epimerase [Phycisphaerales bacterium]
MKLATCNEPWREQSVEEVFRIARKIGYDGVEIAPFTIAGHVDEISTERRRQIVRAASDAGVEIIGLHWLFVSPKGLHLTTPDASIRQKSAEYLRKLIHLCGDLGGSVMTFGSPTQRNIEPPNTYEQGWTNAVEVFASVAEDCAQRNVQLCLEGLAPKETNFLNTVEDADRLAAEIGHPNIGYMLDIKAMSAMPDGILGTIQKYGGRAGHFHANQPSGAGVGLPSPADSSIDLPQILRALRESGYSHWISVEPFQYEPDPTTVADVGFKALKAALA